MELDFKQPETFEAPDLDGKIKRYIIHPVQVEDMPKLLELIDLRKLQSKTAKKKKVARKKPKESKKSKGRGRPKKEENQPLKLTTDESEVVGQIGELSNFVINKCVLDVENNESLPMYHRTPANTVNLVNKIIEATHVGSEDKDPLPKSTPEKTS